MKAILTGLGGQGLNWAKTLREHPNVDVVGYVEPMEANRERAVQQHSIPAEQIYTSLDDAIKDAGADFVMDVTPPKVHRSVAEKAFAAGLHVLGEKPLSDSYTDAKAVVEATRGTNLKHMITQNYRFSAQPRTTRGLLEQGIIGKPGQCDVRFYIPWADLPGTHYVTEPFMLINDMMVHHFDMMRYVLGEDPETVQAMTWNQPWGWHQGDACHTILFTYPSGLRATHVAVGCAVGSQSGWNGLWRIEGPQGSLDWAADGSLKRYHLHRTEEKVDGESMSQLQVPPPHAAMVDEFISAIQENRQPECNAQDNLKSLAMVFGAIQSAKEGRRVNLSEVA